VIKSTTLLIELIEKVKGNFSFLSRRAFEIRLKLTKIANEFMKEV
jgi:hypothetical protein